MKPTTFRMIAKSDGTQGHPGFWPPGFRPEYEAYRSPHGPNYKIGRNFHGLNRTSLRIAGVTGGLFAGAAGIGALYFFADIPRVRIDIMQKIPIIGEYYKREVPPEDNPF